MTLNFILTFIFCTFQIHHRSVRAANQKLNLFFCPLYIFTTTTYVLHKRVSDLETCVDYFALPGRSCENSNVPTNLSLMS